MKIKISEICDLLSAEFNYWDYDDSSVNGLQVEAKDTVSKIGATVDFAESTALTAASEKVDLIICHHGLLWGAPAPLTDTFGRKVKILYDNKINLIGIHLPLDGHKKFGNNIIIAKDLLKLSSLKPAAQMGRSTIGWKGVNSKKLSLVDMAEILSDVPGGLESPLIYNFGPKKPQKVCVVSGAAADIFYRFKHEDFDTFITGEPRQFAYHFAKENNLNAIFAGHYATETFGVRAISEFLAKKFKLDYTFIDEPTGV